MESVADALGFEPVVLWLPETDPLNSDRGSDLSCGRALKCYQKGCQV